MDNLFREVIRRDPIIEEVALPASMEEAFESIKDSPYSFFLNSATEQDFARYSYFGYDPFLIMKSKGGEISIEVPGRGEMYGKERDPFDALGSILDTYKMEGYSYDLPFIGGGIGYLSYDLCHFIERLPTTARDDLKLPDCCFAFYNLVFIHDKFKNKSYISSVDFLEPDEKRAYENARDNLEVFKERTLGVGKEIRRDDLRVPVNCDGPESNFTRSEYLVAVKRVREYILAGDIYQVNLSQRFRSKYSGLPYELYKRLCKVSPAPFSCYLNFGDVVVVGSSPERFLKLEGDRVQTRPMKGTRPRGRDVAEDIRLREELLGSEKDAAELAMIVDLERNDLGKVCRFGTVRVVEAKRLETYATVFQLVATVNGILRQDCNSIDLLRATFPGGSITGCPKIRAMEIIDELEPTKRSLYTGSMGYLGFNNTMDMNIVIRTILCKGENAYFQVGGGIVADSDPDEEYQETLDKARAMMSVLMGEQMQ